MMTSLSTLSNEFIFPLFLLAFFIYVIVFLPQTPVIDVKAVREKMTKADELEEFYELVAQDANLRVELDNINNRELLVDYLVQISNGHGYNFSALDINNSIKNHTEVSQDNYICLPIGCWRVSS